MEKKVKILILNSGGYVGMPPENKYPLEVEAIYNDDFFYVSGKELIRVGAEAYFFGEEDTYVFREEWGEVEFIGEIGPVPFLQVGK